VRGIAFEEEGVALDGDGMGVVEPVGQVEADAVELVAVPRPRAVVAVEEAGIVDVGASS